jgi:hypothetical protein
LKFIARYQKTKFNTTGLNKGVSILENPFLPWGLPALIGSLPLTDHVEACELVLEHTPQIPLWVQLPARKEEAMIPQFMPGLPGLCSTGDRVYMNTDQDDFDNDILKFYEDYMAVVEGHTGHCPGFLCFY